MKRNRVLYLSYDGLTDPLGQSQILPYLCGLADKYTIAVISLEKRDRFLTDALKIKNICDQHSLEWHPLSYHKFPPILSSIYCLWKLRIKARRLHARQRFAIVHCRSYLAATVGAWMKRKYGISFLFDMRGFWADERRDGGLWNIRNPFYRILYRYFKKKEQYFLRMSDHTVVLTEAAIDQLLVWNVTGAVTTIPCCVDLDLFDPGRQNRNYLEGLRNKHGLADSDYVLCYVGSLGTWYMYKEMVTFFFLLKKLRPSAKMLFITPDINRVQSNNDFIAMTAAREEIPDLISLCQASICFIQPLFSKKGSSATKMAEVLAMGLPIVANSGWGDAEQIVNKTGCGVVVKSLVESEMNDAVVRLLSRSISTEVIRKVAVDYFSLSMGINRYRKIYNDLSK